MAKTLQVSPAPSTAGDTRLGKWLKLCSGGMTKIIDGLYIGSLRDACDQQQLITNRITHMVSAHDLTRSMPIHDHLSIDVLRVRLSDRPETNLVDHINVVNQFIHAARLANGNVIVHCMAGASRSVSLVLAYLMSITDSDYWQCLAIVTNRRKCANPNFGFRMQLIKYATDRDLNDERIRMKMIFGNNNRWNEQFQLDCASVRDCFCPQQPIEILPSISTNRLRSFTSSTSTPSVHWLASSVPDKPIAVETIVDDRVVIANTIGKVPTPQVDDTTMMMMNRPRSLIDLTAHSECNDGRSWSQMLQTITFIDQ